MKSDSLGISEMKGRSIFQLIWSGPNDRDNVAAWWWEWLCVLDTDRHRPVHTALTLKGKVVVLQQIVNFGLKIKVLAELNFYISFNLFKSFN